jgi:hypothetical protein
VDKERLAISLSLFLSLCSLLIETNWQTFIVLHFDLLWTHNGKVPQLPNGEAFNNKLLRSIDYTEGETRRGSKHSLQISTFLVTFDWNLLVVVKD